MGGQIYEKLLSEKQSLWWLIRYTIFKKIIGKHSNENSWPEDSLNVLLCVTVSDPTPKTSGDLILSNWSGKMFLMHKQWWSTFLMVQICPLNVTF